MMAAAPEYNGLGIAICPLYSGFARSAHDVGRDFAAVLTAMPVVMSFDPKYVLPGSNEPGARPSS